MRYNEKSILSKCDRFLGHGHFEFERFLKVLESAYYQIQLTMPLFDHAIELLSAEDIGSKQWNAKRDRWMERATSRVEMHNKSLVGKEEKQKNER